MKPGTRPAHRRSVWDDEHLNDKKKQQDRLAIVSMLMVHINGANSKFLRNSKEQPFFQGSGDQGKVHGVGGI